MIFKCKNCGGQMVYHPLKGIMICRSCDGEETQDQILSDIPKMCPGCGAELKVEQYTSATKCESCGTFVILDNMVKYPYGPNVVLPFNIDKQKATEILRTEFLNSLFLPRNFLADSTLESLDGEYVPFWLYDYDTKINYSGIGTIIKTWTTGNTAYTETSKYQVVRKMDIEFKRIPIDASEKMADTVMDLMEPYDYKSFHLFEPKYLSGFYGEAYNFTPDEIEPRAKEKASSDAKAWLNDSIKQYNSVVDSSTNIDFTKKGNEFALLPVWKYTYRYKDKNHDFYVNGQTGKTYGSIPVCSEKLIGYSGLVFAVVTLFLFALQKFLEVM